MTTHAVIYGHLAAQQDERPINVVQNSDGSYSLQVAFNSAYVASTINRVSFTDRSGTIGQASVAQQVMAANLTRKYLIVQNVSDTDMYIDFNTDAVAGSPSLLLAADGGSFVMEGSAIVTDSITIICSGANKGYSAKEG